MKPSSNDLDNISNKRKIISIVLTSTLLLGIIISVNKSLSLINPLTEDKATDNLNQSLEAIYNDYPVSQAAKVRIAEHYAYYGTFPKNNQEASLPPPEKFRGMTLLSLKVSEGGRITLEFDALSGHDGGLVQIIPDASLAESMGLQWRCTTSDYPEISKAIKDCKYIEKTK